MNFYIIQHFPIRDSGSRLPMKKSKSVFACGGMASLHTWVFHRKVKIPLMKGLILRGRLAIYWCVRPKNHEEIAVVLTTCIKVCIYVSVSLQNSRPILSFFLCANSTLRHLEEEAMIWLSAFPFSDSCTKQCVSLALVSIPFRPGISQLEAQVETVTELN